MYIIYYKPLSICFCPVSRHPCVCTRRIYKTHARRKWKKDNTFVWKHNNIFTRRVYTHYRNAVDMSEPPRACKPHDLYPLTVNVLLDAANGRRKCTAPAQASCAGPFVVTNIITSTSAGCDWYHYTLCRCPTTDATTPNCSTASSGSDYGVFLFCYNTPNWNDIYNRLRVGTIISSFTYEPITVRIGQRSDTDTKDAIEESITQWAMTSVTVAVPETQPIYFQAPETRGYWKRIVVTPSQRQRLEHVVSDADRFLVLCGLGEDPLVPHVRRDGYMTILKLAPFSLKPLELCHRMILTGQEKCVMRQPLDQPESDFTNHSAQSWRTDGTRGWLFCDPVDKSFTAFGGAPEEDSSPHFS